MSTQEKLLSLIVIGVFASMVIVMAFQSMAEKQIEDWEKEDKDKKSGK